MIATSRRGFLGGVGRSAASAALGFAIAERLGLAEALSGIAPGRLSFGVLDALVDRMQQTPADELVPLLVGKLKGGTPLGDVVGGAALANARAFGGTDCDDYHALMAMMPSYEMAAQTPAPYGSLPVLKVIHRDARFLEDSGAASRDVLEPLGPLEEGEGQGGLVERRRARDVAGAERSLAALQQSSAAQAYEALQTVVRDDMNVHRVVLSWRAHDLLKLAGGDQTVTMLRQSVRFCIDEDERRANQGNPANEFTKLLPELMEEYRLRGHPTGTRAADEALIEDLAKSFYAMDRVAAARAVAGALTRGFDPEDVGAAISLAATRLLLNDPGQTRESAGAIVRFRRSRPSNLRSRRASLTKEPPDDAVPALARPVRAPCAPGTGRAFVGRLPGNTRRRDLVGDAQVRLGDWNACRRGRTANRSGTRLARAKAGGASALPAPRSPGAPGSSHRPGGVPDGLR